MPSIVCIQTELGVIRVQLELEKAALTTQNFLQYVQSGTYTKASFYRTVHAANQAEQAVKIDVVQGGLGMADHPQKRDPLAHQTTLETGLKHLNGTISMSRLEPGTANAEFFICLGDQPELDYGGRRNPDGQGFAAFGQTITGFDVLAAIHRQPEANQFLLAPVLIENIRLEP